MSVAAVIRMRPNDHRGADPPRPVPFQGDLRNLPEALAPLKKLPNWVCWRWEWRIEEGRGKWTKPPFQPKNPISIREEQRSIDLGHLCSRRLAAFEAGKCDGIGFNLSGTELACFDLDNSRDPATGDIAPEAMAYVDRAASYTEISVSGTGLHVIGYGLGLKMHRKQKVPGSAMEVESYRGAQRYIVVTGNPLPGSLEAWPHMVNIDAEIDAVVAELDGCKDGGATRDDEFDFKTQTENADTGDDFLPYELKQLIAQVPPSEDLSRAFHRAVCSLHEWGWSAARIEAYIVGKPIVPARYANRLGKEIARCLHKAKTKAESDQCSEATYQSQANQGSQGRGAQQAPPQPNLGPQGKSEGAKQGPNRGPQHAQPQALKLDDFYAYMLEHKYIFVPAGQVWPAASVDARLSAVGKLKASSWLDQNRAVEQMTWAPGEPDEIKDRLISDGGWFPRQGCHVFNLYRPAIITPVPAAPIAGFVMSKPFMARMRTTSSTGVPSACSGHTRRSTTRWYSAENRASAKIRCWSRSSMRSARGISSKCRRNRCSVGSMAS